MIHISKSKADEIVSVIHQNRSEISIRDVQRNVSGSSAIVAIYAFSFRMKTFTLTKNSPMLSLLGPSFRLQLESPAGECITIYPYSHDQAGMLGPFEKNPKIESMLVDILKLLEQASDKRIDEELGASFFK